MALAAATIHAVTNKPQDVLWCVDLIRDVGQPDAPHPPEYSPATDGYADGRWGKLLTRLRDALDSQPMGSSRCSLKLVVREPVNGTTCNIILAMPWTIDLPSMTGGPPPVGCWRVWPATKPTDDVEKYTEAQGLPDSFWTDGIPF
ncbi:MAG: hypothetical protein CMB99_01145 [Flavobacteriaceae bacterium]|nr:hypothetical protein [Flavobacteriaceae bacterium]|tara:strand:+ start:549 stop:983 length:435 start_codon:yes stop_codon:yes gene_type:complete